MHLPLVIDLMLDRVKKRLDDGQGMSFAEFTYPLMQAWDWWELYRTGTQLQIGGSDQFGNILAGAEAVKHMAKHDPEWLNSSQQVNNHTSGVKATFATAPKKIIPPAKIEPMGFTVPLLTTAGGEKFGKSAGNAVWLDKELTSTFELYQVSSMI